MNGDRANKQIQRIRDMVEQANSACTVDVVPGELDSVRLTFHCGNERYSIAWVGAWLETRTDDELWHDLEVQTHFAVKQPHR